MGTQMRRKWYNDWVPTRNVSISAKLIAGWNYFFKSKLLEGVYRSDSIASQNTQGYRSVLVLPIDF